MSKGIVDSKWLKKVKHAIDGNIEKYKAPLIVKWFSKKIGTSLWAELWSNCKEYLHQTHYFSRINFWLAFISNGRKGHVSQCFDGARDINWSIERFWVAWTRVPCTQIEEGALQVESGTTCLVWKIGKCLTDLSFTKTIEGPSLCYLFDGLDLLVLFTYVDAVILTCNFEWLLAWCKKKMHTSSTWRTSALCINLGSRGLASYKWGLSWGEEVHNGDPKAICMIERKPLAKPMVLNLKLHDGLISNLLDPSVYR